MHRLRPGFRLEPADHEIRPVPIPLGASRVGGVPDMPAGSSWPVAPDGRPLTFLAQLDLADAAGPEPKRLLPARGYLYFFYDVQEQPWGIEPQDCGRWRALFKEAAAGELTRTSFPQELPDDWRFEARRINLKPKLYLPSVTALANELPGGLEPREVARWPIGGGAALVEYAPPEPDPNDPFASLRSAIADERYDAWVAKLGGCDRSGPDHRLLGHPREEQSPMAPEFAALVADRPERVMPSVQHPGHTITIPGQRSADWPEWARRLLGETPVDQWRLLLQLDSGDDWMWGDCGKLYFWIPRDDLRERRFENVWLVLQCA
jgi:hypothetical protein